jgi:hypothetical protein
VATGGQFQGLLGNFLDHGLLVMNTGEGIQVADLAAQSVAPLASVPTTASAVAFTWPYLVYSSPGPVTTSNIQVRVLNVRAKTDGALPSLSTLTSADPSATFNAVGTGDTLFACVAVSQHTALAELDHLSAPTAQLRTLPALPIGSEVLLASNDRLLIFGPLPIAWDRAEDHYVAFPTSASASGGDFPNPVLAGHFLLVAMPVTGGSTGATEVTIYDTNTLPVLG